MRNLLRTEFFKLSKSKAFWLLSFLALGEGVMYGFLPVWRENDVTGYDVYQVMLMPNVISAVMFCTFIASFVSGEFSSRTFGMEAFGGYSRGQVFGTKAAVTLAGMLPILFLPVVVSTVIATMAHGFGRAWSTAVFQDVGAQLLYYICRNLSMGGYILGISMIVRDKIGTFGVGMGIYIMVFLTNVDIGYSGEIGMSSVESLAKAMAALALAMYIFAKRDLK